MLPDDLGCSFLFFILCFFLTPFCYPVTVAILAVFNSSPDVSVLWIRKLDSEAY